jgi:peptidoglycan/xylan/chitin deacetylase (PgdA/CDA1 family)
MGTSKVFRAVAAGALLTLAAACSSTGSPSATSTSASPAAPVTNSSGAPPAAISSDGVPVAGSATPESVTAALAALPANLRARVPQFPPAPAPTKVTLPTDGKAGIFKRIPTTEKIAFITIDDGWQKDPLALQLFQAANVPITLFLEVNAVQENPAYFTPLQGAGATIQNHTISHPTMTYLGYDSQKRQICGGADQLAKLYGQRPTLFRPPGGSYNTTTLRAAHDCGMKAVFTWTETTDHGKVFYQQDPHVVQPGDIILMHFRPRFVDDFLAVLKAIHKAGLTPARLEDYVP